MNMAPLPLLLEDLIILQLIITHIWFLSDEHISATSFSFEAPYHLLSISKEELLVARLMSPERDVATEGWVVRVDVFTKHRAQLPTNFLAPLVHPYAVALLPVSAAFQARISILGSAAPEL